MDNKNKGCGENHHEEHECCGGNHDHDHEGCGCGHDHDHEQEYQTIKLTLEDGKEVTAAVIEMFEMEEKTYIALLPIGEEKVLLYEFKQYDDGIELNNIESEEEYESVSQAFISLMDELEEEDQE